jgi:POT family proton-dependent oligopeptide transporter
VTWILLTSSKEERARVTALILVFVVVVFFWMSFHQNGLTLTMFARDYTVKQVGPVTNLFFTLPSMLAVIGSIAGIVILLHKNMSRRSKLMGGILLLLSLWFAIFFLTGADPTTILSRNLNAFGPQNSIAPEVFQSFNPVFIVALTFPVMALFAWLNKKGIEPSTPKKIGIGMVIASLGFVIILIASIGLPSPASLAGLPVADSDRVTPYWLMSSYLVLTIAELIRFQSGSLTIPGSYAGWMASCHGSRKQASLCRNHPVG